MGESSIEVKEEDDEATKEKEESGVEEPVKREFRKIHQVDAEEILYTHMGIASTSSLK